jgi:hypothetical protein
MNGGWNGMVRAPDGCGRRPDFLTEANAGRAVSSRIFDRRNVKPGLIPSLERTPDVEARVATAVVARHTSSLVRLADLTRIAVSVGRDKPKTLGRLEFLCIAKLDFRRPDCAANMDPVIASSSFEGLPRTDRLAHGFLSLAVKLDGVGYQPALKFLLLTVSLRLLLVCRLRRFHQLMLSPGHRTKDAFVRGGDGRISIVRASIAQPLDTVLLRAHAVAIPVNRQAAIPAE